MTVPLIDYANLSEERRRELAATIATHTLLSHVISWAGPGAIEEIITQDEYTHDVLIPHDRALYLVYDST